MVDEVPGVMERVSDDNGGWKHSKAIHGSYHMSKVRREIKL
jgi:hypothetical protein